MIVPRSGGRADVFRDVFRFTFGHWSRQKPLVFAIGGCLAFSTAADVLMPVFAGRLVDAIALGASDRLAGREAAVQAFLAIVGLGALMVVLRHLAFLGIARMTLHMMRDVIQDAFGRVQRFSTDWHANSFAGSTVRKITRGMWALDLLNDTLLLALLPSLVVLVGSTVVLGFYWPVMGVVVVTGAAIYIGMTVTLALGWVAPSARLANFWDTRLGGALADAISCNAVVKAFGAEDREDQRLAEVISKWRRRTMRSWNRGTTNSTAQMGALLLFRAAVIATALWLWWQGRATPGDVTYVLTAFFVIQGYLRDVGMHIRNLQRSVNDMEELVDFHAQPIGVPDRPGARPIRIIGGEVVFDRVTFHYAGHATPLYRDFSVRIAPARRSAWSAAPARARRRS
jgi:ATP-binding cassette subfamily B protein